MRFSEFYEKLFQEMQDTDEAKVVGRAQRRKIAMRMKRLAKSAGFKKKKELAMKRMPSSEKIMKLARKAAKKKIAKKYFPKYDQMGINQKIKADEMIAKKFGGAIDKIAKKMIPTIKKQAMARVKAFRQKKAEK